MALSAVSDDGGVAQGILRRQALRESAARTYARALPIVPVRARGMTVEGADGRRYLDCLSGAGALALGHNHPVVLEAIRAVLDSEAPLQVLDLATPVKDAFTDELFATLPPGLAARARVQFCGPAGTDAVEAALKLVRTATGRDGLLAFSGAYHGMTAGALAASGGAAAVGASAAGVTRLPFPYDYRCPFGVGGERGAELSARWAERLLDDPKGGAPDPAGMILEPVQGEGGVIPAPDGWLRRMREITTARSIPLIADEVQTGVGRTGAFWAVGHSGVVPDVMVLSKAIGGGLPLAVVVYREELDIWPPGAHAGTFRGNQLAMAAGTATLAYVRENHLAQRAAVVGRRMLERLRRFAAGRPQIGEVRGRGLMIGLELVTPEAGPAPEAGPITETGAIAEAEPTAEAELNEEAGQAGCAARVGPAAQAGPVVDADWERTQGGATPYGTSPSEAALGAVTPCEGAWLTGAEGGGARGVPGGDARGALGGGAHQALGRRAPYDGVARTTAPPADPALAAAVQQECLRRGLIVELGGRHGAVIRLLPPLTITDEQTEAVLDRLADALDAAIRTPGARSGELPPAAAPFAPPFAGSHR
ncbi:diaminobutyrate--2-oxoglutarate transaminase family protein [Streptomyces sp. 4503]|uniref:Diaminobutyrate--2-oxoglutarate transaminase n=2 Tax=Streptomyces niphimycinicus TaxID=2842201 RepID=A0ABS6CCW8_9ACTN|nr:diaminobutyrate--2-oxoglutarate transaminase family protein [Streptomyces niphimycinicus]MBU3864747.1 diaminobutyrate--2-oxoglutarate transaminase family protein [Streptomyces niphimycinicus]